MQPQPQATLAAAARLILVIGLGLAGTAQAAIEADRTATLEAIHDLENPRNLTRPGPRGELGAYQFRESTWRDYTDVPFAQALDRSCSDFVAVRHYEWLKLRLQEAHLEPTVYNIALAWNGGLRAAITGRAPRAARDYAQRAANLASVLTKTSRLADARSR